MQTVDKLPLDLEPWLNHQESLTDKLKIYNNEVRLQVLGEVWALTSWWEKFSLQLEAHVVRHRDIVMQAGQTSCWFARTIIPEATFQRHEFFFNRLTHESLGVIAFKEPSLKRSNLISYAITEACIEYYWLPGFLVITNNPLWLRLSTFTFTDNSAFYLVEILLPGLLDIIK